MSVSALHSVVGRVVHVSGPHRVSSAEGAHSHPSPLTEGDEYHLVHAEMVLAQRWLRE